MSECRSQCHTCGHSQTAGYCAIGYILMHLAAREQCDMYVDVSDDVLDS